MGTGNLHIGALGGGGSKLAARQQQRCPRTPRLVVVQLLVLVAAAIATDAACAASRHTHALTHRRNSTEAEDRKHGTVSEPKRGKVVRQSDWTARPAANIYPSIERPTVSLPPDLAAAKQAIELIRRGEWKDPPRLRQRSIIRWRGRSSNGHCCAARIAPRDFSATLPSCEPIRIGPACHYCADGPRPSCGRSNMTAQQCAALSARKRAARLADLRSHAC